MRIFKSILLFMNIAIYSQSYSEMIDELKSRGRWGDYYLKESDSFMLITKNINVDSLVFIGDTSLKLSTLNTLFKPIERSSNSSIANLRFNEIKDNNIFISSKSKLNFARYGNQSVAAVVDVKTNFKSHIGGIIGSNKDANGSWKLTGEIDLQLENLFKDGSSFSLFWQQPSSLYRLLDFNTEYPVFSKFPFGVSASYNQEFYENSYINQTFSNYFTSVGRYGKIKIGSKIQTSNNIATSNISKTRSASIILRRDRRNSRWLPYSGSLWNIESDMGTYKDRIGNTVEWNANVQVSSYSSFQSTLLHLKLNGSYNQINGRDPSIAKFTKFGGSNSIRGYNENQFNAQWMSLQSVELIFGDFYRSQFFTFIDNIYAKDLTIKPSSGFGIRVFDGKFFYDVSLGFPIGEFREAKLHIKFNTRL